MAYPYTPPPTSSPTSHSKFNSTFTIPAQDSYFNPPSDPLSSHQQVIAIDQQALQISPVPPPRISSPVASLHPRKTPSPRPSGRTTPQNPIFSQPNPIYYSPTNPVPSPFNASRPKPRLGFRKRMLAKISGWIRKLYLWAQENPIKAGLITFAPVLALAGATRMLKGFGKLFGKGKSDLEKAVKKSRVSNKETHKAKKAGKKSWGWGLDDFVDFNGSKGGPLDGILKILQMWVNHICRVSPSMIPKTMSIFLEVYFLELEKPF